MNIMNPEEAEGLTAEMVRGYMLAKGWTFRNLLMDGSEDAIAPAGELGFGKGVIPCRWPSHLWIVGRVADYEKRSAQSILREMNPRMRKGLPGVEEWKAHGGNEGFWVAVWNISEKQAGDTFRFFCSRPMITNLRRHDDFVSWGTRGIGWNDFPGNPEGQDWSFWPCDAHGNKVPWPAVTS